MIEKLSEPIEGTRIEDSCRAAMCKINELVDAVNEMEDTVEVLSDKVEELEAALGR